MVDRPLEDKRPVGPLMDIDMERDMGDKVQLGVSGTSMPNLRKSNLNVLYVLDTNVATLPKDIERGTLQVKMRDKFDGSPLVRAKRSGRTSQAPFDEQAVIVRLRDDSLPVQQAQINRASNAIVEHYSDLGVGVKNIIMDTE